MSISLVQKNAAGGSGTQTVTLSPTAFGNLITVMLFNQSTTYTVGDNLGSSYTQVASQLAGGPTPDSIFMLTLENCPSGITSVHCNFPIAGTILVIEWSSGSSILGLDSTASNTGTSVPPVGPSMSTTQAEELIITQISCNSALSGVNAPWIFESLTTGLAYLITAPGTFQAVFTPTSNNTFTTLAASFVKIVTHTLTLTDSVASGDSSTKEEEKILIDSVTSSDSIGFAGGQLLSDSMTVTDSISAQSSFVAQIPIPVVQTLVKNLVPAEVKLYFMVQE